MSEPESIVLVVDDDLSVGRAMQRLIGCASASRTAPEMLSNALILRI